MVRSSHGLSLLVAGLFLVAPPSPVEPTSGDWTPADPGWAEDQASDEDALRFRQTFGLDASPDLVRAARLDPVSYSTLPYGIPLSSDEIAEMLRRSKVQTAVGSVVPYVRTLPTYAGVYLDQLARGEPVFMFTDPDPSIGEALATRLPADTRFRVVATRRTEKELLDLKSRIEADIDTLSSEGLQIVRVAVKTSQNRIRIGVYQLTAAMIERLASRYGQDIEVFEDNVGHADECPSSNDCRPIKGGISINHAGGSAGECTAGFVVRGTNGVLYMLTAGHCVQKYGGYNVIWQHNSDRFGAARYETWRPGGTGPADVGLITIDATEQATMTYKNRIRRVNNSVTNVIEVSLMAPGMEGAQACRVGRTSGHDCGTITEWRVGRASKVSGWNQMWVTEATTVNFDSLGGDSGGPVFYYLNGGTSGAVGVLGTHIHSEEGPSANEGWFSGIIEGDVDYKNLFGYGYSVCLLPGC